MKKTEEQVEAANIRLQEIKAETRKKHPTLRTDERLEITLKKFCAEQGTKYVPRTKFVYDGPVMKVDTQEPEPTKKRGRGRPPKDSAEGVGMPVLPDDRPKDQQ